jgi:hypothetical protein
MQHDQLNELDSAFRALSSWSKNAEDNMRRGIKRLPKTNGIRRLLSSRHPQHSISRAQAKHRKGSLHIVIRTKRWPAHASRGRSVNPAHFAILRALELIPGMRVALGGNRKPKVTDPKQMIFNLSLSISKSKAKRAGTFQTTQLERILFNAGPRAKTYERRYGDYARIVPERWVLIRSRPGRHICRNRLLDAAWKLVSLCDPTKVPFSPYEMCRLLEDLFAIADVLHWDDLVDRLPEDELHRSLFPWSPRGEVRQLLDWIALRSATGSLRL